MILRTVVWDIGREIYIVQQKHPDLDVPWYYAVCGINGYCSTLKPGDPTMALPRWITVA